MAVIDAGRRPGSKELWLAAWLNARHFRALMLASLQILALASLPADRARGARRARGRGFGARDRPPACSPGHPASSAVLLAAALAATEAIRATLRPELKAEQWLDHMP